jgi:small GTP-binding protein
MGAKGAYIVRLLMVGDSACGKTSLVLRFDQNVFSTKFVTTIGVDYRDKMVKVRREERRRKTALRVAYRLSTDSSELSDAVFPLTSRSVCLSHILPSPFFLPLSQIEGASMRLQLWDTAGQERFRSLTSNFFGRADGFVLTYDISNRPSFDHVIGWMRDIKTRAPPDCDIVLCGNKSDLDNDRVVSLEEGKQLAEEYGVQFFETSALTGQNVEKMFTALATTIKHKRIDEFENQAGQHGGASVDHASAAAASQGGTVHLTDGAQGGTQKAQGCC